MMKRDLLEVGASMAGGLGIGAVLMYLLDPDQGSSRRQWVGHRARQMADNPSRMVEQARQSMQHARQSVRRGTQHLRDRAAQWMPTAPQAGEEESCPVAKAISRSAAPVVGALALGAGLMYLLDPISGRRRRARLRDKAVHYTTKAEHRLSSTGRHLSNKAKGIYHDARGMMHARQQGDGHRLGAVEEHGQQVK